MDINVVREVVTVLSFGSFVGIVFYAINPRNKDRFEEASRLPFDDEPGWAREGAKQTIPHPNPLPREREQTLDESSRTRGVN